MKKIIKALLVVMVVVLALTAFVACDKEEENTEPAACEHKGGKATCTEAAVCELCGEIYGEALGHKGGTATCGKLAVCATCGVEYGELLPEHTVEYHADEYYCEKEGLSSGSSCSVCGKVIRQRFPLAPTGHKMSEGTCTDDSVCLNPGCDHKVEAPGHTWTEVEEKAATCTEDGYTAHKVCECGEKEGYEVIPGGHVVGEDGVCTGCQFALVDTAEELIAAIAAGNNVLFEADIEIAEKLNIVADTVIDGAGHTLTYTANGGRVIEVALDTNGANLTVNNLTIKCTAGWVERGINYNTSGTLTLNKVTIEAVAINYAINLPGSSDNCTVVINDSHITGFIALNAWGENANITITNTELHTQNHDVESGACISVNFSTDAAANYTKVTVNGGKLVSYYKNGELSNAVRNYATGSTVTISETTVVEGEIIDEHIVAAVTYPPHTDFYAFVSLQGAIDRCLEDHANGTINAKVVLLMNLELDTLTVPCGFEIDLNGYTLTVANKIVTGHTFVEGSCSVCGAEDPDYVVKLPTYVKVTSSEDFTTGTYVIVVNGKAVTYLDGSWVLTGAVTVSGDTIVSDSISTWTLTVSGSSVTMKDSKGTFIKPKSGNNNGIQSGSYNWAWTFANGGVTFKGTGSDTTILALNNQEGKIRSYKSTTVSGNPASYPSSFAVYKLVTE